MSHYLIVLVPATIDGQTLSPFVEAGALAEASSGGAIDGLGGHVELGIFVSPTWWIGVRADAIKRRYNDARWSTHSLIVGTTRPTAYDRIAVEMSGGFGALRSKEWCPIDHEKAVMPD